MFENGAECMSWLQEAMGDVADCEMQMPSDKTKMCIKQIKARGVEAPYIKECLADELYNDVDTLVDLLGDRIYGLENRTEVLDYLFTFGHTALKEATIKLRRKEDENA